MGYKALMDQQPSDQSIDTAIQSAVGAHRYKVARILAEVSEKTGAELEQIANRIQVLVSAGTLVAHGSIDNWRHSEIELTRK